MAIPPTRFRRYLSVALASAVRSLLAGTVDEIDDRLENIERDGPLEDHQQTEQSVADSLASDLDDLVPGELARYLTNPTQLLLAHDLEIFLQTHWADVRDMDPVDVGHDFIATRNGWSLGFWDVLYSNAVGHRLTSSCVLMKPFRLRVTDTGHLERA